MDYNIVWYLLVGVLLIGYAILDGFDLGVGIVHLFAKTDHDRRIQMNSIGPVWDGNEVWLITGGGALFAAFPHAYATGFSTFYIPFMLLLMALIFRAVSLEFRSKEQSPIWRGAWDMAFSFGSILASFLFGLIIGDLIMGLPIGADKEFQGNLLDVFSPFGIVLGIFTVIMFAMHGSMYLIIKTEGELQTQIKKLAWVFFGLFVVLYAGVTGYTLYLKPEMMANFSFGNIAMPGEAHPLIDEHSNIVSVVVWAIVALNVLAIANISRSLAKGKEMLGFISSAATIAALITLFALGIFPNLMISNLGPELNLDIYNAASSEYTLKQMFTMAIFGMPFVIAYTSIIYWTYRGKTQLTESSY